MKTYTVKITDWKIDAKALGLVSGDTVLIPAGTRGALAFDNLQGITITGAGATINEKPTGSYGMQFTNSKNVIIEGKGLVISGGQMSLSITHLSTDFVVKNLKVLNSGYAGIMAKTDPTFPEAYRGAFLMQNMSFIDCEIGFTGGEGFYISNSHYVTNPLEHETKNVFISGCYVHDTGRDGIQVFSNTGNVDNNKVINTGTNNEYGQRSAIQIQPGSVMTVQRNWIMTSKGWGVFAGGVSNDIKNNYINGCFEGGVISQSLCKMSKNVLRDNVGPWLYAFQETTCWDTSIINCGALVKNGNTKVTEIDTTK